MLKIPNIIPHRWALLPRGFGNLSAALTNLNINTDCALTITHSSLQVFYRIYQWYRGEITGEQALRSIIDTIGAVEGQRNLLGVRDTAYLARCSRYRIALNKNMFDVSRKTNTTNIVSLTNMLKVETV